MQTHKTTAMYISVELLFDDGSKENKPILKNIRKWIKWEISIICTFIVECYVAIARAVFSPWNETIFVG